MHVVLVEPQIAPNTGAIIRLCANAGVDLHLVEPLGFDLSDARLRRGGLDYHDLVDVTVHPDVETAREQLAGRWFVFSASGADRYGGVAFRPDDVLVFGTERSGLRAEVMADDRNDRLLTIPMVAGSRSLNLANAVAVVVYEAWRQLGFEGAAADRRRPIAVEAFDVDDP